MSKTGTDSPGVPYPPPLLYVTGFGIGYGLTRVAPVGDWPAVPELMGPALVALGLLIAFWAIGLFLVNRTAIIPHKPASAFVAKGPYRFTRNPMYVSLGVVYLGLALIVETGWAIAMLPLVLLSVQRFVIRREEAYLERRFGTAYLDYKTRVRRWL